METKPENPLFFKKWFMQKSVAFVAKIQQMLQKKFPTILWYLVYFQIFFLDVIYINMFQRKTSEKLRN